MNPEPGLVPCETCGALVHRSELRGTACNECWQTLPQVQRLIGGADDVSWELEIEMHEERILEEPVLDFGNHLWAPPCLM